jgi:hypothetical protein
MGDGYGGNPSKDGPSLKPFPRPVPNPATERCWKDTRGPSLILSQNPVDDYGDDYG